MISKKELNSMLLLWSKGRGIRLNQCQQLHHLLSLYLPSSTMKPSISSSQLSSIKSTGLVTG
jgi:hypothetical protein